jgi:nitrate reductase NapE component
MSKARLHPWRIFFLLGAAGILTGGPRHPDGTMAEMIGHPDWLLSHLLVLAGYVGLLAGLLLYARSGPLPDGTRRWARLAIIGTALQVVEMIFHTAAMVDHGNLVAGRATPVLTTHLVLALLLYPVFAITIIGFIVATARERTLGSRWIAWIGVLGAAAHGAAPPLVLGVGDRFSFLFPMIVLVALWMLLAAVWPLRAAVPVAASRPLPSAG